MNTNLLTKKSVVTLLLKSGAKRKHMETLLIGLLVFLGLVNAINLLTSSKNDSDFKQEIHGGIWGTTIFLMILILILGKCSGVIPPYEGYELPP
jgi:hypothetical protein